MARRSIGDVRRAELSQAAWSALVQYGIRGTTLDRVAKIAGVSKGVVLHHFLDKDALFEGVQRQANTLLRDCVVELLRHADTPLERLYAIIAGNFAAPVFQQEICHAWISLCSDVPHNSQSQRIQTAVHARMRSNLLSALRPLLSPEDCTRAAFQLRTVMDGLWLRASFQPEPMPGTRGVDEVDFAARRMLLPAGVCDADITAARAKMEHLSDLILSSRAYRDRALAG
ncbi:transcriptional regulator BetI [Roseovarius sp. LXJ103]|uniref:transcriptional regulator BetI n=1 Tax=Roseovarius carneus TaxID=2853164 RepID=UPI000D606B1A|nr:transcriptional regulator BetI [Roseovarius carneus]MBZ8118298.1 transcriptional regulator BetI [Roseovarius carneus]PWE35980.1 transcriptional regulator BetI [Pelagicola sp. LXJ1103]